MSKWIEFVDAGRSLSGKTRLWNVVSKQGGNHLGNVFWYAPWRKYAFSASAFTTVFEQDCLRDIADFIEARTKEHKAK